MQASFASLTPAEQGALLEGPAMKPPPGVTPDFINPPNDTIYVYGVLAVCASLSTMVVAIRVYAKVLCTKKMHIEDYFAIAAWGLYAVNWYFICDALQNVGGYIHQWDVRLKDLSILLYDLYVSAILFGIIIMLLKVGIMLEWMRVFVPPGIRDTFFWTCCVTISAHVAFAAAQTFAGIFACSPRERSWNRYLDGTCTNEYAVYTSSSALTILSDIIIFVLPQKVIWNLRVSLQKRIGISLIFAVGVMACVCASMRLHYNIRYFQTEDKSYAVSDMTVWASGEFTAGFFVLCMPSVPKAVRNTPWTIKLGRFLQRWIPGFGTVGAGEKPPTSRRYHFASRYHARRRNNQQLESGTSDLNESALMRFDTASATRSLSGVERTLPDISIGPLRDVHTSQC